MPRTADDLAIYNIEVSGYLGKEIKQNYVEKPDHPYRESTQFLGQLNQ